MGAFNFVQADIRWIDIEMDIAKTSYSLIVFVVCALMYAWSNACIPVCKSALYFVHTQELIATHYYINFCRKLQLALPTVQSSRFAAAIVKNELLSIKRQLFFDPAQALTTRHFLYQVSPVVLV